jgi:O-antigen/teichoic acid export membrane protein
LIHKPTISRGIKLIQALSEKRHHVQNLIRLNITVADQIVVSGVNFLTGVLIARFLGPEEFGRFTFVWMIVLLFYNLQYALIIAPMMSIGPKQSPAQSPGYFGANAAMEFLFSSAVFVLLLGGLWALDSMFTSWRLQYIAFPLAFSGFVFLAADFLRRFFYTIRKEYVSLMIDIIGFGGQLFGVAALVLLRKDIMLEEVFYAIGVTFTLALILGIAQMVPVLSLPGRIRQVVNRHKPFVSGMVIFTMVQWAGPQIIMLISGTLLGPASLGGIRAIVNLLAPINVLMLGLQNILPAKASRVLLTQDKKALSHLLLKVFLLILGLLMALSILVIYFKEKVIMMAYNDPNYLGYAHLIAWQITYLFLDMLIILVTIYLKTLEQTKRLSFGALIALPISFVLVYMLSPLMQETATFLALLVNQVLVLVWLLLGLDVHRSRRSRTQETL